MEKNEFFEIFSILSKVIIILPIVVVIIGLVYKLSQVQKLNPNPPAGGQIKIKNSKPNQSQVNNEAKINIDLKGPLICKGKIDSMIVDAFIKDKKIKVVLDKKNIKDNLLFNDDCYYSWRVGEYVGEKICGLSSFVTLAETMTNFGGLDSNLIINQLKKLGLDQKIATNEAKISELVKSCKKKEIDMSVFEVPSNILFKNK